MKFSEKIVTYGCLKPCQIIRRFSSWKLVKHKLYFISRKVVSGPAIQKGLHPHCAPFLFNYCNLLWSYKGSGTVRNGRCNYYLQNVSLKVIMKGSAIFGTNIIVASQQKVESTYTCFGYGSGFRGLLDLDPDSKNTDPGGLQKRSKM